MSLAYWAISLANMDTKENDKGTYEKIMKAFVYIFIIDLGISPFVKCYNKRNLFQACVASGRVDFLRELLNHKYEVRTKKDLAIFKKTMDS